MRKNMINPEAVHFGEGDLPFIDIVDGPLTLEFYYAMCEEQGLPRPRVLVE